MDNLARAILMAVNCAQRVRDAVYLDTNAWSTIAKGEVPVEPVAEWARQNGYFIWLARMQVAELSARRDIVEGIADTLERISVVMVDRGQNEFGAAPWYRVPLELQQHIHLTSPKLKAAFIEEFAPPKLDPIRAQLKEDGARFREWLDDALGKIPRDEPRDWLTFKRRVSSWIRQMCIKNGHAVNENAIADPACYVGIRLGFAVLFSRYYVNRQAWRDSDYLDYLHAADMAYAKLVVTERNLAECLRQARRRQEIDGPEFAVDISWLRLAGEPLPEAG